MTIFVFPQTTDAAREAFGLQKKKKWPGKASKNRGVQWIGSPKHLIGSPSGSLVLVVVARPRSIGSPIGSLVSLVVARPLLIGSPIGSLILIVVACPRLIGSPIDSLAFVVVALPSLIGSPMVSLVLVDGAHPRLIGPPIWFLRFGRRGPPAHASLVLPLVRSLWSL